ncbi:hypothetical protein A2567_00515 [Candidatus Azambacteria bacterium RIFOXYD1_FULL_42_11]|uniref:Uncharacterized protein n=4 Tax=Candidatus Azamiibacteriota TaxID=1752741 RepID=A0A0G1CA84_9BACT|nr:MAG: hypothetical protein UV07_C0009G0005 [Candidatus Azambacteria bacterium GW2011_GWB1_42_17]KKS46548.1 MAG: hypothetical protein UV10_C0001G0005 [Candidatus Azambacteria bacterium GW2011_GWA1_42_19]KKS74861.1 MAG: hypothetical protein UV48_C0026G0007 [Candidatus Azambacteria bacterium GW2011_GWA2_42_9]KKS87762.1 MAG: hypothetical protein UV62_C0027G0005 [Parcubacteria group bacterium GW2011_GWC1_43_11]OGD41835.1 MAG: hypothetical protein A2567_00515 [Candidatus Azambacteria bacterium RIFO
MKSAFIIFLIISFLGVAIFGFVSMIFGDIHNGGCIAENRLGAPCPLNGAFTFVVFHLDAFKYFSTAVLGVILLILLSGMIFSVLPRPLNGEDDDFVFQVQGGLFPVLPKIRRIIRWLSLHINSPDFILAAA